MDALNNFAVGFVSGVYNALETSIVLTTGHGLRFPEAPFNLVWWNNTDYPATWDDPNVEIVRVTSVVSDILTVTRGQEGTLASTKTAANKQYRVMQSVTAALLDQYRSPVVDAAKQFGVVGGAAETTKLELIRQWLLTRPGSTLFLPPVEIQSMTPKWLAGVKDVTIYAVGTTFHNLSAGTNGGSDMDSALYLGSGPFTHSMTTGNIIDGSGAPMSGITVTSGHLISDMIAGTSTVTFVTPSEAALYDVGDNVLLHWFSRQTPSYPPNPAWWEYAVVAAVGASTVTLKWPVRHTYRAQAPDETTYTVACGKARILNLNRSDYNIADRVVLIGGKGIRHGIAGSYDGCLEIAGALHVEVREAEFGTFFPGMSKNIECYRTKFTNTGNYDSEPDKLIDRLYLEDCTLSRLTQGTGVLEFHMLRGQLDGTAASCGAQLRSRTALFDGVVIASQGTGASATQIAHDQYPNRRMEFRNCVFLPNASQVSVVDPGNTLAFTPDVVSADSMQINTTNAVFATFKQDVGIGQRITLVAGTTGEVFVITDVTRDVSGNVLLAGRYNVGTPAIAATLRLLWFSERAIFARTNRILNPPTTSFLALAPYHKCYDTSEEGGTYSVHRWILRGALYQIIDVCGTLVSVSASVIKPYTGADATAVLTISRDGASAASWAGMTINAKVAGRRLSSMGSTSTALSGDTLASIPQNAWTEQILLYMQGAAAAPPYGVFTDAAEAGLPLIEVVVECVKT